MSVKYLSGTGTVSSKLGGADAGLADKLHRAPPDDSFQLPARWEGRRPIQGLMG